MKICNKNTGTILRIVEICSTKDDDYIVRAKDEEGRQITLELADLMKDFETINPQEFEDPNVKLAEYLAGPLTDAIRAVEEGRVSISWLRYQNSLIGKLVKKLSRKSHEAN